MEDVYLEGEIIFYSQGHTTVNPLDICVVAYEFQCSASIIAVFLT